MHVFEAGEARLEKPHPTLDFERASAVRPISPAAFQAEVPDGWQQGRGAFGGLVFGLRPTGPMPFAGGRDAETAGYVRERLKLGRRDAASMLALLDAWWPTLFSIDDKLRPMATSSFVAELLVDPSRLDADERLFHTARMASLANGFFVELRELWSGDTCVAMNQQTFAVLR